MLQYPATSRVRIYQHFKLLQVMGPSFTTKYADFTEARTPPWGIALLGENLQSRMALGYLLLLPRTLIHCLKTSMSLIQLLLPAVAEAALSPIEDENRVVLRQRSGRTGRHKAAAGRSQLVPGRTQNC